MTNAERIRNMTDEELAEYIYGVSGSTVPCVLCEDDCDFCECSNEECMQKTLNWLKSEAEEKYRCAKEVYIDSDITVPVGAICDVVMHKNIPCIFYHNIRICEVDSIMQKLNFKKVEE